MCLFHPAKKVADNKKGASLLHYIIYYSRKKFYDKGILRYIDSESIPDESIDQQNQEKPSQNKPVPFSVENKLDRFPNENKLE